MKRNLTLLTLMGALIAVAVPASASAVIKVTPAGHNFEMSGETMPSVSGTSLPGTCTFTKLAGTVPAAPKNEGATEVLLPLSTPTGTCTSGVSIAFSIANIWALRVKTRGVVSLDISGLALRYSSLPGCRLDAVSLSSPTGIWSNAIGGVPSAYHADGTIPAVWGNDGASTCSIKGKAETLSFRTNGTFLNALVKDTTIAGNVIIVSG
jgi:hypothetical protein